MNKRQEEATKGKTDIYQMDKMGKIDNSHKTEVWSPERKDVKVGMSSISKKSSCGVMPSNDVDTCGLIFGLRHCRHNNYPLSRLTVRSQYKNFIAKTPFAKLSNPR